MGRAAEQQTAEQPGHQRVAGQHHGDAQHVVGQRGRLEFGDGDYGHQRHDHQPEAADPALEEFDLGLFPAEVQLCHATWRENPVGGVEHQPCLGHLQQRRAHVGVLPAGVDLQGVAAQRQAKGDRHRQQNIDQDRLRGVPLAVTLEVADVLVNLVQPRIQGFAPPQQRADQQCQRQEQQRTLGQAVGQFAEAGGPAAGCRSGLFRRSGTASHPFRVQRLVAGNPEHLLIEGRAQVWAVLSSCFWLSCRVIDSLSTALSSRFRRSSRSARVIGQVQQALAQLRGDLLRRLGGQQVIHIGRRVAHQFTLLVDFELIQANVGDLVGQVAIDLEAWQGLLLFIENLRQQQAALEHVDLFVQGRVALGHGVELLFGLQVLLGDFVEAVGAFEQVVGELEVGRAFGGEQAAAAGLLRFDRLLGNGLLGLRQALLVDQGLQVLDLLVQAVGFLREQVMLAVAQVLQLAVAGQFLATQRDQRVEGGEFGVQLVALLGAEGFAGVFAGLEDVVDLLDARLAAGNFRLGALGAGLRGDDQAVGVGQGFLQIALLGRAIGERSVPAAASSLAIALRHRHHFGGLEARQFALCSRWSASGRLPVAA